ncbi:MAG: protein-(glutamine-N5) methyltransferase, release factor-specific, partial [Alphaproteobacteria bacterium]
ILSNPPYIRTAAIRRLEPEVADFDPRLALDGGRDGLDAYRLLLPALGSLLEPEGAAVFELGQGQARAVAELAAAAEVEVTGARLDLAGRTRVLVCRAPGTADAQKKVGRTPFRR